MLAGDWQTTHTVDFIVMLPEGEQKGVCNISQVLCLQCGVHHRSAYGSDYSKSVVIERNRWFVRNEKAARGLF